MAASEKVDVSHADVIEPVNEAKPSHGTILNDSDGLDVIVTALQHTGEEVGMTWRSFMAAMVSTFLQQSLPSELIF